MVDFTKKEIKEWMENRKNFLCYRCEHRARALESTEQSPMVQCKWPMDGVLRCPLYKPVRPLTVRETKERMNENYPDMLGPNLQRLAELEDMALACEEKGDGNKVFYWRLSTADENAADDQSINENEEE